MTLYKKGTWFRKAQAPPQKEPAYKKGDSVYFAAPTKDRHSHGNVMPDSEYYRDEYLLGTILSVIPKDPPTVCKYYISYPDQEYLVRKGDGPIVRRSENDLVLLVRAFSS